MRNHILPYEVSSEINSALSRISAPSSAAIPQQISPSRRSTSSAEEIARGTRHFFSRKFTGFCKASARINDKINGANAGRR